jgi:hypothetical protein
MLSGGVPLLNWNPEQFRWSSTVIPSEHRSDRVRIDAVPGNAHWLELEQALDKLGPAELQISIGESLAVFIRIAAAASESRILVARPESERLVCTCALSPAGFEALREAVAEKNVQFHRLGRLHFLSNLEMVWKTSP